jgi:hypothetical protein
MASTTKSLRASTANKRPTTAISDGQIALNTNATSPGLYFKDSTGTSIIKIGPVHVGTTAPNVAPAGSSGNSTGEAWLDTSLTPNGWKVWTGAAWTNATPVGSDTVQGLLELATNAETQAGSDTARAVTPAGLQSKVSDSTSTTSSTTIASSTAVKVAYDLANAALPTAGGTVTGNLEIGTTGSLTFEGSIANAFETAIAVVNPTADRTITFPDTTGTVVTTGDTGTVTSAMIANSTVVDADISASAEIAVSKLADGAARQLLQTDAAGTGVEWTTNVDVPGTLDVTGTTTLDSTLSIPLGSAALPTVFFTGDSNTGIYSPGADQVAITTGGTGRLFIDSSGRLLAGTSTARSNFFGTTLSSVAQIEGTGGSTGRGSLSVLNNDVSNNPPYLLLGRSGAASLGSNAAVVNGSRLGTLTFHGADGTSFIEAATVAGEVDGTPGANDMPGRLVFSTTADNAASPTERMRITQAGFVGIGTTSPGTPLQIAASTAGAAILRLTNNSAVSTGNRGSIVDLQGISNDTGPVASTFARIAGLKTNSTQGDTQGYFQITTNNGSVQGAALTIDSSQRVGIGTSTPGSRLTIAQGGGILAELYNISASVDNRRWVYSASATTLDISCLTDAGSGGGNFFRFNRTNEQLQSLQGYQSGVAWFHVDNLTARLGIGTTSPQGLCDVTGSNGRLIFDNGSTSGGMHIAATNTAYNANGYLAFYGYGTEYGRFDNTGSLLIGTSSSRNVGGGFQASNPNQLFIEGSGTALTLSTFVLNRNDTNPVTIVLGKSRGTAAGGNTVLQNNDFIGRIIFAGADGTDVETPAAFIEAVVDGTPGANDMPGRLVFSTTADGAASPTERMRISQDGAVKIAGDNFQIATSKTPASATATGTVGQIAWDANYIYVCTATNTWKRTAIATW